MENIKKEFYIKALVDVYEDSYTDGELDWVNYYKIDTFVSALTINEAITEFFNNNLYFKVDLKNLDYDVDNNCFYYSVLCDNDNDEVDKDDIIYKKWIDDKIDLYSNNISLYIYEVTPAKVLDK